MNRLMLMAALPVGMLLGCVTPPSTPDPAPEPERFAAADAECVDAVARLEAYPLKVDARDDFDRRIAEAAGCLRQGEHQVPALLFDLRDAPPPFRLAVSVYSDERQIFACKAVLLDDNHETLGVRPFDEFNRRGKGYTLTHYEEGDGPTPAYLLLTADTDWVGREDRTVRGERHQSMWMAGGYMGTTVSGTERDVQRVFSELGRVGVQLESYEPTVIGQ